MKIATFKWTRRMSGYQLPYVVNYTAEHVNILGNMLARHLTIPYEFVCITDDPTGIKYPTIPLWDKCQNLGGCYNRLWTFSADFDLLGDRFALIDLDVVLTNNCDHIFGMKGNFLIHEYCYRDRPNQHYNAALVIMDRGARRQVWDQFDPRKTPDEIAPDETRIGSDQKWISTILGPGEKTIGVKHGVYEAMPIGIKLPEDACMVFFSGRRDPSEGEHAWVRNNYY